MRTKYVLLGATAFGVMLPAAPAFAQDESEIIVTARKRQESILEVPVVTTVLNSAMIERAQVKDLVDIGKKTTGLQLGIAATETGTNVSLRGFGTTALDPGIDQSVSLNLDGMQITQGMAYSVGFFDMAQVEVLKGPQALFFGKASPAGVISIRTNDPGDELEVIARSGYEFEAKEWRNELILSAPLGETFGVRIAGMYDHLGGFFKNTSTVRNPDLGAQPMPHRFGETNTYFIRGTALFKPDPSFSARLKLNYTKDKQLGAQPGQIFDCPDGPVAYIPGLNFFSDNEDCKANRKVNIVGMDPADFPGMFDGGREPIRGGRPASNITQKFGTLELNYDVVPELTLTSVTGYYKLKARVDFNCIFTGGAGPGCMTSKDLMRREFTQELRMNSDFKGPFNFTLGGFFQDGKITDDEILPGNTALGLPPQLFEGDHDLNIKSYSFFGQARWQVVPELELAAGARWTHEKRSDSPTTIDIFGASTFGLPGGGPGSIMNLSQPKLNSSNWSPEFTITYTPTEDLTIFGSLKQAYKSGSYNLITPTTPRALALGGPQCVPAGDGTFNCIGDDKSFGDEKVQGGEIGLKSRLMDRQLTFNMAGYYYKLKDLQVGVIQPFAGLLPVLITLNAASAKIYGVEADFTYRPRSVEGLEVFGAVNWNHGRFQDFIAPCDAGQTFAQGCNLLPLPVADAFPSFTNPAMFGGAPFRYNNQDLSGSRLAKAPDWSGNIGFFYEMHMAGDITLGLGADSQFSSKYIGMLGRSEDKRIFQDSFAKFNATVSVKGRDDAWEVAFIGNNLTNELTVASTTKSNYAGGAVLPGLIVGGPAFGPAGDAETFGYLDRGRELWIRVTLRPTSLFGGPSEEAPPPPPPPAPATQTCPDGAVIAADQMCPAPPPPPPPPPEPELKAGERGK